MVLVDVSLTAAMLIWPQWIQGRSVSRLVMSALGLVVLYFLINAPELFVAADSSAAQLQGLAKGINYGVHVGLMIAAVVDRGQHRGGIGPLHRAEARPGASGDGVVI